MVDLLSQGLGSIVRPEVKKKYGVESLASTLFNIFEGLISDLVVRSEEEISTQKKFILELLRSGVLT
jgi:hypothetical protein